MLPSERPTVQQLLQHPLLAEEEEPPSPSPLMLKIPASPDLHHYSALGKVGMGGGMGGHPNGVHGPPSPTHRHQAPTASSSRKSCQTCRNSLTTERKRYLSKSREAIFEKVSRNSNLKKSLSKSRERLCDMRLTISKSRESLSAGRTPVHPPPPPGVTVAGGRKTSRDESGSFLLRSSLSRSQEVLSSALGGAAMKRVAVNGTVSDISHALTTGYAAGTAMAMASAG